MEAAEKDEFPRLIVDGGLKGRYVDEAEPRGYISNVFVQGEDGICYPVFFCTPLRIREEIETTTRLGQPWMAEPGMIVLPVVTAEAMVLSVRQLWREGFFSHLTPAPLSK